MTVKRRFILDENILIRAQTGLNERDEPDSTCTKLVTDIIRICHTIVIDTTLWTKYQERLHEPAFVSMAQGPGILRLLAGSQLVEGKFDDWARLPAPPFEGEERIPAGSQDDIVVTVRLAVDTRDTLVTADHALQQDLRVADVDALEGLEILTPEQALAELT